MTVQPRKEAPDLSQFFDEPSGSKKAKLREAKKTVKEARKTKLGGGKLELRSPRQRQMMAALQRGDMVIATGVAGGGKTYLAMRHALQSVLDGNADKIIVTRPAVAAGGEEWGFLPGAIKGRGGKTGPWALPLLDVADEVLSKEETDRWLNDGRLEFAPIAFMRGRTLADAIIIVDEAQNTTPEQMKLILTRIGEGSQVIVTGDLTQSDRRGRSGLGVIERLARDMTGVTIVEFETADCVRSALCRAWVEAFEEWEDDQRDGV